MGFILIQVLDHGQQILLFARAILIIDLKLLNLISCREDLTRKGTRIGTVAARINHELKLWSPYSCWVVLEVERC